MATATKKKEKKKEAYPWKAGASSGHTTNLKQSILRLLISMLVIQLIPNQSNRRPTVQ
jgi:hypothetical protein